MATIAPEGETDTLPAWPTPESFKLWLSERLPEEIDPHRVLEIAAEALGRYLNVARVGYGELEPGHAWINVPLDWTDGVASMAGRHPFYPESAIAKHYRAGKTLVVEDASTLDYIRDEAADMEATDNRAFVGVPLVRQGELVALFTAIHNRPRTWSEDEVALIAHTGARIWGALEHLRTTARLRDSDEQFRTLAENMPGICWLASAAGEPYWVNQRGAEYFGNQDFADNALAGVHPDDLPAATALWTQALATGAAAEITVRMRGRDGVFRPFLSRAEAIRDAGGAVVRWCGVQLDLSDKHNRDRHEAFFRAVSDAIRDETSAPAILATVAYMLKGHLGVDRVVYSETEGDGGRFVVRQDTAEPSLGPVAESYGLGAPFAPMLDAFRRGETVSSADVSVLDTMIDAGVCDAMLAIRIRAALNVPLVKDGKLAAVLSAHHGQPRTWTAEEVALVEEVAERTWSTVTRARAEAELQERERAQAFLIAWSDGIRHETSTRAILSTTLSRLGEHLGCTRLSYAETDDTGAQLSVLQQWGEGEPIVGTPFPFAALGERVIADHLTGHPLVVTDVEAHPLFDETNLPIYRVTGIAALASVPLVRDGKLLAVLCAQQSTLRAWTEAETRLLCEVADRTWAVLERARFEERLAQSEALLAAFMEHAPVGMHLKDADGRYLRLNPELAIAIGRPAEEILGYHPSELFPPEIAERIAAMETRAQTGAAASEEFVTSPRDRYASLLSIVFPIKGDHAVKTGGFTLDLTERKEAEVALQRSRDALYQSEKLSALGSLLAGVSHELNNPLSIVVAQAVMMERQAKGSELAERAFKIRKAADRCARIVQTFLAMARQKKPERTAVDLNAVAQSALELADYGLRADGVGVTRTFVANLPRISADGDQLHQIVTNLVVNAQQAMAGQSALRWLTITTGLGPEPRTVILEVADTGPGVPAEARRRIFEPFYTTKPQGEGTGVGLSFSQGLAEAHGGRLTLVPSDTGAVFRLTMPIDERLTLARVEPMPAGEMPTTLRRALIVDDEEEIAASLADFLAIEGFECEIAVGGAAAQLRLAGGPDYDLVVSDLRMPDVDGPTLYAWIVAQRPDLAQRTAFTTGDTLGAGAARFLADAGRPVLEKPFMPDSVRHFLNEMSTR